MIFPILFECGKYYFVILILCSHSIPFETMSVEHCYPLKRAVGLSHAYTNYIIPHKLYTDIFLLWLKINVRTEKISLIDKLYDIQRWTLCIVWFCSKHFTDFLLFDGEQWKTTKNHHENRQYCLVSLAHFLNPLDWNYTKEHTSKMIISSYRICIGQNV